MTFGCQPELLQRLHIELHDDLVRRADEAEARCGFQIGLVGVLVIPLFRLELVPPEAFVLDVTLELVRVRRALAAFGAIRAAPARQRADARRAFVVGDIIGIAARIFGRAVLMRQARQTEADTEIDQHFLERPHVPVRCHDRLADRVRRPVSVADRAVQQGNAVPALQICGVRQDQIGIGHHLGGICVGIDDLRYPVFAGFRVLVRQLLHRALGIHRRIPAHVRHVHEQGVDRIRVLRPGIVDDHVHHAVHGHRRIPGESLVDPGGVAGIVHQQVFRAHREAERGTCHRGAGLDLFRAAHGFQRRRRRTREGWLVTETTRAIDAAEQHLQHVQGAAGMEAVGMGGDAAHGMHGDGAADHLLVPPSGPVGPGYVEGDFLLEGGMGDLGSEPLDCRGIEASLFGNGIRRIGWVEIPFGQQFEGRNGFPAVRQDMFAGEIRRNVCFQRGDHCAAALVEGERAALGIAGEQAVIGGARILDHQPGRVRVAHQIVQIDFAGAQQLMHQRQNEQSVRARPDTDPLIRDGGVTSLHRVDGNELGATGLDVSEAHLDRVRIMILGDAEHHEILGVLPVRLAELPEGAADGIQSCRRHVDGTEPAMRRVVRGAELAGPPPGQRLGLVPAGEEGELARVALADVAEPFGGSRKGFVPLDFLELSAAAFADPFHRLGQPRRGVMLHDPGGSFGAEHALVHRVIFVALDVPDRAVAQVNFDAAAAGTHVAGRELGFVGHGW